MIHSFIVVIEAWVSYRCVNITKTLDPLWLMREGIVRTDLYSRHYVSFKDCSAILLSKLSTSSSIFLPHKSIPDPSMVDLGS